MDLFVYFILLCVVSIPLFTIEFFGNIFEGEFGQFRFFTILTNLLCWIYYIVKLVYLLLNKNNREVVLLILPYSQYLSRKSPSTTFESILSCSSFVCTVSITLVCIVFWAMLSGLVVFISLHLFNLQIWKPHIDSVYMVFDHLIVPITKVIDYFYFTPNDMKRRSSIAWSIVYPFLYYCFTLIYGICVDNWFPYWFMNPNQLSWVMIGVWFVVLLLFYLLLDWIYLYFGKKVSDRRHRTLPL